MKILSSAFAIIITCSAVALQASTKYPTEVYPAKAPVARGTASTSFTFSPPEDQVKFRHAPFTTISCFTRTGLVMTEPGTTATVTGFSTAPFARIVGCNGSNLMTRIP